ncbi:Poly(A) polymerase I [Spatholobus suberectus]|nr:Poly(A) polymerase I [Spatholobus suberectus]
MAVPLRIDHNKRGVLARLKTLVNSQSFHSRAPKRPLQDRPSPEKELDYTVCRGRIDVSKWKTLDAEELGLTSSMISYPSRFVLKLLRSKGFESYLVGGCVRDLLLNRTPKDFDVITTAKLMEVRKQFRRSAHAKVVGRRFPVCLVHIKGSVVEVTSFETVAQTSNGKEQFLYSLLPKCSNKKDLFRCKNSFRRDFTINSLFYDPFANKIYDYTNGMADLRSLKLETVIPAQLSFKEDPGRILRGFRIAARLGLSLSRETEAAIWTYSSLVKSLDKNKIMIELNYMLSYGAAEPSLRLLWKFKLLEFLLPVHAAYLDEQAIKEDAQASNMLMKLFFHLDNLVACDRPCDCTLWIGLLAFHLALVNDPQDALVVWAFASVLYHGEWEEGVKFAKEPAKMSVNFAAEIRTSSICKSDEEIAKAVTKLASLVMHSIPALVESNSLLQFMSRYPSFLQSGMVFVPRKAGKVASAIFKMLASDVKFYKSERRKNSKINYGMLGKGNLSEIGFVLGKIVLETMSSGIVGDEEDSEGGQCHLMTEGTEEIDQSQLPGLINHQLAAMNDEGQILSIPNPECRQGKNKKQKLVKNRCIAGEKMGSGNHELFEKFEYKQNNEEHQKLVKLSQKFDLSMMKDSSPKKKNCHRKRLINDRKKITSANKSSLDQARNMKTDEHSTYTPSQSTVSENHQVIANNYNINVDAKTTNESDLKKKLHSSLVEIFKVKERQKPHKNKRSKPPLTVSSSDE